MPEDSPPATKQDLNELREQMREQITEVRDQLVEQMRDMQTEVLRAFHDWAQPVEIKLRARSTSALPSAKQTQAPPATKLRAATTGFEVQ